MVFSGIVETKGIVLSCAERNDVQLWDGTTGKGTVLRVRAPDFFANATMGCSIAVNGVCLTVVEWSDDEATFNVAPETVRRTNLDQQVLKSGDAVNLERSLKATDRNSGHYVQGHVDGTGALRSFRKDGDSLWVQISAGPELLRGIVEKGCICVDGVSLTVVDVNREEGWFSFMLVPHTQSMVTLPGKTVGAPINLELDVMGKYAAAAGSSASPALELRVAQLERQMRWAGVWLGVLSLSALAAALWGAKRV
jgi:riboflavin synthase